MKIVSIQVNEVEAKRLKIRILRKLFPVMARKHDARAREWYRQQLARTPAADAVRNTQVINEATTVVFTPQEVNHDDGPWHTGMLQESKRFRQQADAIDEQYMHDAAIFWGEAV